MKDPRRALLAEALTTLRGARDTLAYSLKLCQKIGLKEAYTLDELDRFEALTSRFARLSDLLTHKLLRLIDEMDLETPGTVRDRIHRAEKKSVIASSDDLIMCRVLRNEIAHEYRPDVCRQSIPTCCQSL